MMKVTLIVVLCLFVGCAFSFKPQLNDEWTQYKRVFHKSYNPTLEEGYRRKIWEENIEKIASHNRLFDMGLSSYKMSVNKFTDMSHEEFLQKYTMHKKFIHRNVADEADFQ